MHTIYMHTFVYYLPYALIGNNKYSLICIHNKKKISARKNIKPKSLIFHHRVFFV